MNQLKLVALDAEDLNIVSAHVQDAVLKVGDIEFSPASKLFVLPMYRFAWEAAPHAQKAQPERRNSVLHFHRVTSARVSGISREKSDTVLSLLAIIFTVSEEPAGAIDLVFSGGGTIRLQVECIEARLADLGGAWEAESRPVHTG